jgi:murein DD-endopeptidase MepM/ murein hydrolase activator NlpD
MALIAPILPPDPSAPPPANAVWPIKGAPRSSIKAYKPNSGRTVGASRSSGARAHAGVDILAKHKDTVLAIADGVVISFYYFYRTTFSLFINHGDYVINYGEVDRYSLFEHGLKTPWYQDKRWGRFYQPSSRGAGRFSNILASPGSEVKAGQPIAKVGKMFRDSMLHLEMYTAAVDTSSSSAPRNKSWRGFSSSPPSDLLNATAFIETLADRVLGNTPKQKEPTVRQKKCR